MREKAREKSEDVRILDDDGKLTAWAASSLQTLLCSRRKSQTTLRRRVSKIFSRSGAVRGMENNSKDKKKMSSPTHGICSSSGTARGMENNRKDKKKMSSPTHGSKSQTISKLETPSFQELKNLMQKAVQQGESIFEDSSFIKKCYKVLHAIDEMNKLRGGDEQIIEGERSKVSRSEELKSRSEKFKSGNSSKLQSEMAESLEQSLLGKPIPLEPLDKGKLIQNNHTARIAPSVTSQLKQSNFSEKDLLLTVQGLKNSNSFPNKPSFADILKGNSLPLVQNCSQHISNYSPCSTVHDPISTDSSPIFKIDPNFISKRMEELSHSIIGRLSLSKGEEPWTLKALREKLEDLWKLKSDWRLISLGRGYYHILLRNKEEWEKVWSRGSVFLKPGVIRLQKWSLDFDPTKEKTTFAQVWFRIHHLPWGLWDPQVLAGIARKVGNPLRFDKTTLEGNFGHYARILIDVDLSKSFMTNVHVQCGNNIIEVKLVPEKLPSFCKGCNTIGHLVNDCRTVQKKGGNNKSTMGIKGGEQSIQIAANIGFSLQEIAGDKVEERNAREEGPDNVEAGAQGVKLPDDTTVTDNVGRCLQSNMVGKIPVDKMGRTPNEIESTSRTKANETGVMGENGKTRIHTQNKFQVLEEVQDCLEPSNIDGNNKNEKGLMQESAYKTWKWGDIATEIDEKEKVDARFSTSDSQRPSARSLSSSQL